MKVGEKKMAENANFSNREENIRESASELQYEDPGKQDYEMIVFADNFTDLINPMPRLLIEELSKYYKILFVEEPYVSSHVSYDRARLIKRKNNLIVIKPLLRKLSSLKDLLKKHIDNEEIPVGWFYTAASGILANNFKFKKIVYDFDHDVCLPHKQIQVNYLTQKSHYLFTSSKSVFEEKSNSYQNIYWIPYPFEEFLSRHKKNCISQPTYIINPERPIIGYCGLIDDNIDFDLIRNVAEDLPQATFVFIGPVLESVKEKLPQKENINFLNLSHHSPNNSYLNAFDIAMLPYLANEKIGLINSKIFNYMAANKPIISTSVNDVVRDYGHCINVVTNSLEFCQMATNLLSAQPSEADDRWICYSKILHRNSWEEIAFRVKEVLMNQ
jgi:glycosyltransferase involved in cell wall biosynthesis